MRFPQPLTEARLLRRYKRFLADVELPDGSTLTVHCANPGGMTGLLHPCGRCWISDSGNPKRKLRHSLELVEVDGSPVLVNTARTNPIVEEALRLGTIAELADPEATIRREVKAGDSRLDFRLESASGDATWVEVKQVTLAEPPLARFPDARTKRGARHLDELRILAEADRAVILFAVTRTDCTRFEPADDVDPDYGHALRRALDAGVEALVYRCEVSPDAITLDAPLPLHL